MNVLLYPDEVRANTNVRTPLEDSAVPAHLAMSWTRSPTSARVGSILFLHLGIKEVMIFISFQAFHGRI